LAFIIPDGGTDSWLARSIKVTHEDNKLYDSLACEAPPGIMPYSNNTVSDRYGFHEINFAINDVDSSPISFSLQSREEIVINALRVRKDWQYNNSYLLTSLNNGGVSDGYIVGVSFGGPVNFTNKTFRVNLKSAIENTEGYFLYSYTRALLTLTS